MDHIERQAAAPIKKESIFIIVTLFRQVSRELSSETFSEARKIGSLGTQGCSHSFDQPLENALDRSDLAKDTRGAVGGFHYDR